MLERHVGIKTSAISLNSYSSTPEQVTKWLQAIKSADQLSGSYSRLAASGEESESIQALQRGVFLKNNMEAGQVLSSEDVYFAFPVSSDGITAGRFIEGSVIKTSVLEDQALTPENLEIPSASTASVLKNAIHDVKAMLNHSRITLGSEFYVEYSHHYGVENFRETGVVLITVINREYCKKILVQLPGQAHPMHFHKRKEETFLVVSGSLFSEVDGRVRKLHPGDTQLVLPGVWHRFWSEDGCVFEEISTTHYPNDSVYKDPEINLLQNSQRKTVVDNWGRFQLLDGQ